MSCACEHKKMSSEYERILRLAKAFAQLEEDTVAIYANDDGTYGYKITQDVRTAIEVSESTLYPVLRRLQKDGCLEVYDQEFGGRNRRYYILRKI